MNATDVTDPSGVSRLCLSCHDGSLALDDFGGVTTGTTFIPAGALVGGSANLTGEHPISFTYDDALASADGELHPPTTTASGLGAQIDDDLLFGVGNDQLECASCHDVHNWANNGKLLVVANTGSALCLTCHNK